MIDKDAVPGRGLRLQTAHRTIEGKLDRDAQENNNGQHRKRDECERPRDDIEHAYEQDGEQQVRCRDDAARGEELADRVKFAQLIGQNADGVGALRQLHREHVFENVCRKYDVDLLAREIDDAAAHHAQERSKPIASTIPIESATKDAIAPFGTTRSYTLMMKSGAANPSTFTRNAAIATWL